MQRITDLAGAPVEWSDDRYLGGAVAFSGAQLCRGQRAFSYGYDLGKPDAIVEPRQVLPTGGGQLVVAGHRFVVSPATPSLWPAANQVVRMCAQRRTSAPIGGSRASKS